MESMQWKGCVHRIRECVFDLLSMEELEEVVECDEETWELMGSDLRLKSTFLYCDLNHLISAAIDHHKKLLADLANNLFHHMEQLDNAVKRRSISLAQAHYGDIVHVLHQVMAAIMLLG